MDAQAAELRHRSGVFEKFKSRGLKAEARGSFDDALFWHCAAATVAWTHPFGRWLDAEIEQSLSRIARSLPCTPRSRPDPDRLVVQTSFLTDGGGHAEILLMTIEDARLREKFVVSSEWQDSCGLGGRMLGALSCPALLCPRQLTPTRKVLWLYERLNEISPSKVILSTAPNDVLGITALAMYRGGGAEVLYYDQAETYDALLGGGVEAALAGAPSGYDAGRFAMLLKPCRLCEDASLQQIAEALAYAPRPGVSERFARVKRRARESLRYRTGY
jgi:hypothetical protein